MDVSISWCYVPFPQLFTFSLEGKSLKCESGLKIPAVAQTDKS